MARLQIVVGISGFVLTSMFAQQDGEVDEQLRWRSMKWLANIVAH
jgi:hypothetical protein